MTGIDIDLDAHPCAQRWQVLITRVDAVPSADSARTIIYRVAGVLERACDAADRGLYRRRGQAL
jgi:hypothetical protein